MKTFFRTNDIILFQGDSITDCNRNRLALHDLGDGYVNLINHYLSLHYNIYNLTCYNKGISGDRSINLKRRWNRSTLNIQPDVLSILIGINDTWKRFDRGLKQLVTADQFYHNYKYLLDQTLNQKPDTHIILMSPFLLPINKGQLEWFDDLYEKIEIIQKLSKEYNTKYIPLNDLFQSIVTPSQPNCYWTEDGIHPTPEGHAFIAKEWIKAITC